MNHTSHHHRTQQRPGIATRILNRLRRLFRESSRPPAPNMAQFYGTAWADTIPMPRQTLPDAKD
jgi:hypothetical protein